MVLMRSPLSQNLSTPAALPFHFLSHSFHADVGLHLSQPCDNLHGNMASFHFLHRDHPSDIIDIHIFVTLRITIFVELNVIINTLVSVGIRLVDLRTLRQLAIRL